METPLPATSKTNQSSPSGSLEQLFQADVAAQGRTGPGRKFLRAEKNDNGPLHGTSTVTDRWIQEGKDFLGS